MAVNPEENRACLAKFAEAITLGLFKSADTIIL